METPTQRHVFRQPAAYEGGVLRYGRKHSNWRGSLGWELGLIESSCASTVHRPSVPTETSGQRKAGVQRGLAGGKRTTGP